MGTFAKEPVLNALQGVSTCLANKFAKGTLFVGINAKSPVENIVASASKNAKNYVNAEKPSAQNVVSKGAITAPTNVLNLIPEILSGFTKVFANARHIK